jgi:hydroxymethylglutaryl-CoA reductase
MIPPNFRKLSPASRKEVLKSYFNLDKNEIDSLSNQIDFSDLSDVLVESSIGTFPVPLGIAAGFLIDGETKLIPMATEEPSVIAAASYASRLVQSGGGFHTWADHPVMTTQIYLKDSLPNAVDRIKEKEPLIASMVDTLIPRMVERGGGYRGLSFQTSADTVIVSIDVDVKDAMGANILNTIGEGIKDSLAAWSGGTVLMSILTNACLKRMAGARFVVPSKAFRKGTLSGKDVCLRIVEANRIASQFPERAVTHNKGIMNGIIAVALATGNDTRSVEAGAHFYAQQSGSYLPLTTYDFQNDCLIGTIQLPMSLGTVGGTTGCWPPSLVALKILGSPGAQTLNRIAAAVGLAQNLAALFALVTQGIQGGHMKLHAARIAYAAGARGEQIRPLASQLWNENCLTIKRAKELLENSAK